jgi:hypothetical protein
VVGDEAETVTPAPTRCVGSFVISLIVVVLVIVTVTVSPEKESNLLPSD